MFGCQTVNFPFPFNHIMFSVPSENRLNGYFSKIPSTPLTLSHLSYFLGLRHQHWFSTHPCLLPNMAGGNHVD